MRMSKQFGRTLREAPADAETISHQLLVRAGFIDQLSAGVYSYLPSGLKVKKNIERIIRKEMDTSNGIEVLLPTIQPSAIWEISERLFTMQDVLFKLEDKRGRTMVLGPTHEEVITTLFSKFANSYRDLPRILYQIQTKLRDETRPRGGLVRVREFTMKDAYSFDLDEKGLDVSYNSMVDAYHQIFNACEIPIVSVEADSGAIGGKGSQEFIFLTNSGEDTILICDQCDYAANQEKAEFIRPKKTTSQPLDIEKIKTPETTTIDQLVNLLKIDKSDTAKAVLYMATPRTDDTSFPIFVVIRGDLEINEVKLMNLVDAREITPMSDEDLSRYNIVSGYASPIGITSEIRIIADISITETSNLVSGANEVGYHLTNTNYSRDWVASDIADIAIADDGNTCAKCTGHKEGNLKISRGIEMGHVFRLGKTYTSVFETTILDQSGKQLTPIMGCYGIGIDRILSAAVEAHHDQDGIIWPKQLSPYNIHLTALNFEQDSTVAEEATKFYEKIQDAGLTVLFDDRDENPGVKFKDADLIGIPIRITISSRNNAENVVELKLRNSETSEKIKKENIIEVLQQLSK
ncbi:MAG: proline--tRNA ligase [Chloroflexi bacterium]|nr:proline--tRNA ligase [Chloroflexota bacterium]